MKERSLGIYGRKLGMSQIFDSEGQALGVTVLELGPNLVIGKRTKEQNKKRQGLSPILR
jgi:large subunit ribosomal protein L3